jgi:hypothetical protein
MLIQMIGKCIVNIVKIRVENSFIRSWERMEIIKFIFSSFWVFIGVIIILDVILSGIAKIISAMFSRKYYKEMVELIKELNDNEVN